MRIGIIDLGTNSIRFDVHEMLADQPPRRLYRERLMVKLGHGVFSTGYLNARNQITTRHAFRLFRDIGDRYSVDSYIAVGTSALRDAKDASDFIAKVKEETGISVEVISGAKEARLIAQGFIKNEQSRLKGNFLLIDIGGGSTEFTVGKKGKLGSSISLNLGAARLHQLFLQSESSRIPSTEGIRKLREHVRTRLERASVLSDLRGSRCFGSSGSIRALCKLGRKKNGNISLERLSELVSEMESATRRELIAMPRMEEDRVDLILAGAILLEEILTFLGVQKIETSEISLRDGIVENAQRHLARIKLKPLLGVVEATQRVSQRVEKFRLSHRSEEARKAFYTGFFDALQQAHHLSAHSRSLFLAFYSVLPLSELFIGGNWESWMSTLSLCTGLLKITPSERLIVSQLLLHLCTAKIDKEDLPFRKNSPDHKTFLALHAISRACYALDGCLHKLRGLRLAGIDKDKIRVTLSGTGYREIAILRVDALQELYKQTFGRGISISFTNNH